MLPRERHAAGRGPRLLVIFAGDHESARKKGVENLLLQYDEQGYFVKVILVSPYLRRDARIVLDDRHELREFGFGRRAIARGLLAPFHVVRVIVECCRLVRREGIDVIRATEPTLCGFIAWATSGLTGRPYLLSLHADYDKRFALDGRRGAPTLWGSRALIKPLERLTMRGAARVLPIRESLIPYVLGRGVSREKVRVTPHGIDLAMFLRRPSVDIRKVLDLPPEKAIVAFAGRLSAENYVDDILNAVRHLAQRRNDFVLVLAGGGVLEEAIAARLHADPVLARVVRPIGFVSQETVHALRSACAVSLCLMGGFSLIEACAAGRPVIAYDVEWHHELVVDGETGRLLREHDVTAVADALAEFLDDRAYARRLGEHARERAFARHGLRQTQDVKRQVYAEVLDERVGRAG